MLRATRGSCVQGEGRGGSLIVIRDEMQAQEKKKTGKFGMVVREKPVSVSFPKSLFVENVKIFQKKNPGDEGRFGVASVGFLGIVVPGKLWS